MKVVKDVIRSEPTLFSPRLSPPNRQSPELIGGCLPLAIKGRMPR